MSATTQKPATQVTIGPCRLSFFNGWIPTSMDPSQPKKYNTAILIDKKDKKTVEIIKKSIAAAEALGKEKYGKAWIASKLKVCLHDGDEEKPNDEVYAGHYFLSAKSVQPPSIVDRQCQQITDQNQVYSGCWAYISLNFFPFNNVSIGVGCGLGNIMKAKDDTPFSGRSTAEDDFADLIDTDDVEL